MADNGHDVELESVNPAVIPSESEQDFLRRVWIEGLAEMLGETKSRWEDAFRTVKAEATAAVAELRAAAAEFHSTMEGMVSERLSQIHQPIDGKDGPQGERGQKGDKGDPGELPMVRAWSEDEVSYAGDCVFCGGGTWQAHKDTSKKPPHADWKPLALPGRDAVTPAVRGTYRDGEAYRQLDIVALNGGSFIARAHDPGPCPGDGWQLIASAGRAGKLGPKGERGEKGERGLPGQAGLTILGWRIDRERYRATPLLSDGSEGSALELRPLFQQYNSETSGN
jgi:hypothetical protein